MIKCSVEEAARFYAGTNLSHTYGLRILAEEMSNICIKRGFAIPLNEYGLQLIIEKVNGKLKTDEDFDNFDEEVVFWRNNLRMKSFRVDAQTRYGLIIK